MRAALQNMHTPRVTLFVDLVHHHDTFLRSLVA